MTIGYFTTLYEFLEVGLYNVDERWENIYVRLKCKRSEEEQL